MPRLLRSVIVVVLVLLALAGLLLIMNWAIWANQAPAWTGFGPYDEATEGARAKTLWDWLDLLIVGAVIAAGGILLNRSARNRELMIAEENRAEDRRIAERRREQEQRIANDNRNQAELQAYYDKTAQLLLDYELKKDTEKGKEAQDIARARTLATLKSLDGTRKGSLLQFLYESELIGYLDDNGDRQEHSISLSRADLSGAYMPWGNLDGAELISANLEETTLFWADLRKADLRGAGLREARLHGANLSGADLREADLSRVDLREADLREADLRGVTYDDETKWPDGFDPEAAGAVRRGPLASLWQGST